MIDLSNSDFDVNILENALSNPNLELTFPLPTDQDTYVPFVHNEKVSRSFELLEHFINFFTSINVFEIYKNAEYRYSINKSSQKFKESSESFMNRKLMQTDKTLDDIVYDLVNLELRMNLIKASEFSQRFTDVKEFMVNFYKAENEKNLPNFGSQRFIRLCYITVIKTISKMFPDGVWVNREQFSNLYRTYIENPMSIALLPNHQSHIDYVILHLIMIRFQMSIPTVIAGDNLNVAIFGGILKGLGGIFIKRSFNNEAYTETNLMNYIEFIFLNKIHFEVFIEGTRSRDGKLLLPKYGILKILASIYNKQRIDELNEQFDFLVQPVSITYERIYEADGYLRELVGQDKKQESFFNIMSNGITNLFARADENGNKYSSDGYVDNSKKTLKGKIFVKLAENFPFSSYANNSENSVYDIGENENQGMYINLKKLGFRILHSINDASFLPESAIVGITIQTFYYYHGVLEFLIEEIIPMMNFLIGVLKQDNLSETNSKLLQEIDNLNETDKAALIESQTTKFFRYTKVNPETKRLKVVNTFELLYYKNLSIHLIIHRCLVSLILLKTLNIIQISKLYYIFTGFLKNEFLFDYDYKEAHELSYILKRYQRLNLITDDYEIKDSRFHEILAAIILPFIDSFGICVDKLTFAAARFSSNSQRDITEHQLMNDEILLKDYPTTKSLLRTLQKDNIRKSTDGLTTHHAETYNKQYLLSFLFYLNNLKLIKILKNKSKTEAYVIIRNSRDLHFISSFMKDFERSKIDNSAIAYMIDIVDKSFERVPHNVNNCEKTESKL